MKSLFTILLSGLCLGYINGISSTPLISSYFYVMVVTIIVLTALLTGIKVKMKDFEFDVKDIVLLKKAPLYLAMLLMGFSIGASGGIYIRNNGVLDINPNITVNRWYKHLKIENPKTTYDNQKNDSLKKELFEIMFNAHFNHGMAGKTTLDIETSTGLLNGNTEDIDQISFLCGRDITKLRRQIELSHNRLAVCLSSEIKDDSLLHKIICALSTCK